MRRLKIIILHKPILNNLFFYYIEVDAYYFTATLDDVNIFYILKEFLEYS